MSPAALQARMLLRSAALGMLALALQACGGGAASAPDEAPAPAAPQAWVWQLPAHFPRPKVPADNPMSEAKVALGRHLFYEPRLSGNGRQSCAGCHHQDKAFTDGLARAIGSTGQLLPRSSQHLGNAAYHATLTWANPSLVSLERQMETPLFGEDPVEMGVNDANKAEVLARLRAETDYRARFAAAFPGEAEPVQWPQIIKAIAAFQRSLISGNSKYDRHLQGRDLMMAAEERGMRLFFGEKAACFRCHGSFNFNDQVLDAGSVLVATPFHNTGLYNIDGKGGFPEPNRGVFELTARAADMGRFRAPSLRNVELTAPYMHDGSVASLEEVLRHYAEGGRLLSAGPDAGDGRANPYKSELLGMQRLSEAEQADIVQFLKTLTDHEFVRDPRHGDPFKKP